MRKVNDRKRKKKKEKIMSFLVASRLSERRQIGTPHAHAKKKKKKRMAFLVATTSLPAVYRPNGYARTTTAGTPHARANILRVISVDL